MLKVAVILMALASPAFAGEYFFSLDGDDASDCTRRTVPCRTPQLLIRKLSQGRHVLNLAPGHYSKIDVFHGLQVAIWGPYTGNGTCTDLGAVTVDSVSVQDNATIWVHCLTAGDIGCRQWSIADISNVVVGHDGGVPLAINETCRINTMQDIRIKANVSALAIVQNYSTLHVGGRVIFDHEDTIPAYLFRAVDSTIDLRSAMFSGHTPSKGLKFSLDHGVLHLPKGGLDAIPGKDFEMINYSVCRPSCVAHSLADGPVSSP